jgi:site-specific DNA recombinase
MKAAIYCRVSTDSQEKEGTSLQTQLEHCIAYCQSKRYEAAHRFKETYSGLTLERPELERLRELVRDNAIDVVVCYSVDRLSRDPTHGVILTEEFEKHGVILETVTEPVDSSDVGKLITYIRGFSSKLEVEKIKDRTLRGKKAAVKQGRLPQGTGVGIYGYTWDKRAKTRKINRFEAIIVKDIFERMARGESVVSIARTLNAHAIPSKGKKLWHSLTIRRMIRNQAYIGKTYYKGTLLPSISPAIVNEELFEAANTQLDKPKARTGRSEHEYLLRNHAFCGICGKPLVGHCLNRKYLYYQCSNARPYENSEKKCPALYIRARELEDIVWSKTKEVLANPEIILKQLAEATKAGDMDSIDAEIKDVERKLRAYERRKISLIDAIEFETLPKDEIRVRANELKRLCTEDQKRLETLKEARGNLVGLANATIKLNQIHEGVLHNLENATSEVKRLAFDALDIKVYASKDSIEIKGVVPLKLALPTTERTSALPREHNCPRL